MIVVTGASGTNGRAVLDVLRAKGVEATAMVRNMAKEKDLAAAGTRLVQGDLGNPASLDAALRGATSVFALAPVHPQALQWFSNLFDAAKRAGVKHVVKFSGMGADEGQVELMRQHKESDERLIASGLSFTILRPNSFFQNMLWSAGTIKQMGKFFQPLAEAKQSFVDVRDIAEVAAAGLTDAKHAGKIYEITGPEALGMREVAAILSKATGKTVEYVAVSKEAALEGMLQSGMPEWNARALSELLEGFKKPRFAEVQDTVQRVLGKPARRFEDFARENAAAFS